MPGQITPDNHFHLDRLCPPSNGNPRIGLLQHPIGHQVAGSFQKIRGQLIEHLTFKWNGARQHHIKSRNPVGSHHHQQAVVNGVHVPDFAAVKGRLSRQVEMGLINSQMGSRVSCMLNAHFALGFWVLEALS